MSIENGKTLPSFQEVADKVESGERITERDAMALWEHPDLSQVGELAHQVRCELNGPDTVTYIIDRNVNYSNACVAECKFCAFWAKPGSSKTYTHDYEPVLRDKIAEAVDNGATQILMQGGFNPDLEWEYYLDLCSKIKRDFPDVILHSFGPPEINFFSELYDKPAREVLAELQEAGWDSLPGSYEILVEEVQEEVSPGKCSPERWLEIMEIAAEMGINTTATMMFGHVESVEDRITHMRKVRELQDRTGDGFRAFINWPYQSGKNALTPKVKRGEIKTVTAQEYLRTTAVGRVYLDNIDHIQASWVTMGPRVGSVSLFYGVDDMGGTMMEENVVSAAGTTFCLNARECERIIEEAGFQPQVRNTYYEPVERPPFPEEKETREAVTV